MKFLAISILYYLEIPTDNALFFEKYLVQIMTETIVIVPCPIPPNTA